MVNVTDKIKDWAVIIALLMSGITGKVTYDNHGLSIEIEKTQKALAAVQEHPQEAIKAVPQVKREFKSVDYDAVANNAKIAEFIARQLLIQFEIQRLADEDEEESAIMLLLMA